MNTKCKEVNSVKEIYLINANAIKELNENSLKIKRKYEAEWKIRPNLRILNLTKTTVVW